MPSHRLWLTIAGSRPSLQPRVQLARRTPAPWQSGRPFTSYAFPGRRPPTDCAVQNHRRPLLEHGVPRQPAPLRNEARPARGLAQCKTPGVEHGVPRRPAPLRNKPTPARGLAQCKTAGGGTRRATPPGAVYETNPTAGSCHVAPRNMPHDRASRGLLCRTVRHLRCLVPGAPRSLILSHGATRSVTRPGEAAPKRSHDRAPCTVQGPAGRSERIPERGGAARRTPGSVRQTARASRSCRSRSCAAQAVMWPCGRM